MLLEGCPYGGGGGRNTREEEIGSIIKQLISKEKAVGVSGIETRLRSLKQHCFEALVIACRSRSLLDKASSPCKLIFVGAASTIHIQKYISYNSRWWFIYPC